METLFTDEECEKWVKDTRVRKCCKAPEYVSFLKQDRAIDEMPSLYKKCKNCGRIVRVEH